jgi:hypothetical protein
VYINKEFGMKFGHIHFIMAASTRMTTILLFQIWLYKTALETPSEEPLGWHCITVAGLAGKYSQHRD